MKTDIRISIQILILKLIDNTNENCAYNSGLDATGTFTLGFHLWEVRKCVT